MAELSAMYDIRAVAYDRWRIDELKPFLEEIGLELDLVEFGQGFKSMAPAVESLERVILDRQLNHGKHPVLTMCAANCVVVTDPNMDRKFNKQKSIGRIDGIVALGMACRQADMLEVQVEYDVIFA
jgi:phage terminase large subunit-like protein